MNKEENRFDDFLRERLDQHTVEVSPSVWEKINAQQKKRQKLTRKKQKRHGRKNGITTCKSKTV